MYESKDDAGHCEDQDERLVEQEEQEMMIPGHSAAYRSHLGRPGRELVNDHLKAGKIHQQARAHQQNSQSKEEKQPPADALVFTQHPSRLFHLVPILAAVSQSSAHDQDYGEHQSHCQEGVGPRPGGEHQRAGYHDAVQCLDVVILHEAHLETQHQQGAGDDGYLRA